MLANLNTFNNYVSTNPLYSKDSDLYGSDALKYNKDNIDELRKLIAEKSNFGSEGANELVRDEMIYNTALGLAEQEKQNREHEDRETTDSDQRKLIDKYAFMLQSEDMDENEAAQKAERLDPANVLSGLTGIGTILDTAGKAIDNANGDNRAINTSGWQYVPIVGGVIGATDIAGTKDELNSKGIRTGEDMRMNLGYTNQPASVANSISDALTGFNEDIVSPLASGVRAGSKFTPAIVKPILNNTLGSRGSMGQALSLGEDIALNAIPIVGTGLSLAKVGLEATAPTVLQNTAGRDRISGEAIDFWDAAKSDALAALPLATFGAGAGLAKLAANKAAKSAGTFALSQLGDNALDNLSKKEAKNLTKSVGKAMMSKNQAKADKAFADLLNDSRLNLASNDTLDAIKAYYKKNPVEIEGALSKTKNFIKDIPSKIKNADYPNIKGFAKDVWNTTKTTAKELPENIKAKIKPEPVDSWDWSTMKQSGVRTGRGTKTSTNTTQNSTPVSTPQAPALEDIRNRMFTNVYKKYHPTKDFEKVNFDATTEALSLHPDLLETMNRLNTLEKVQTGKIDRMRSINKTQKENAKQSAQENRLLNMLFLGTQTDRNALSTLVNTMKKANASDNVIGNGGLAAQLKNGDNLRTVLGDISRGADKKLSVLPKKIKGDKRNLASLEQDAQNIKDQLTSYASLNNIPAKDLLKAYESNSKSVYKLVKRGKNKDKKLAQNIKQHSDNIKEHAGNNYLNALYNNMYSHYGSEIPGINYISRVRTSGQPIKELGKSAFSTMMPGGLPINMGIGALTGALSGDQENMMRNITVGALTSPLSRYGARKLSAGTRVPNAMANKFKNGVSSMLINTSPQLKYDAITNRTDTKDWKNNTDYANIGNNINRNSLSYYASLINSIQKANKQAIENKRKAKRSA